MAANQQGKTTTLQTNQQPPTEIKVVLLGHTGVGKSSIILQYTTNQFKNDLMPTLGTALSNKQLTKDGKDYKFQIWDTAGQEKYKSLAPLYYREATAAIIVYDTTRRDSFEVLKNWVDEVRQHGPQNIIIAIVGNKMDLVEKEQVSYIEARNYAKSCQRKRKQGNQRKIEIFIHQEVFFNIIDEYSKLQEVEKRPKSGLQVQKAKKKKCC